MRSFAMIIISFYNMGQFPAECILDISNFMVLLVICTHQALGVFLENESCTIELWDIRLLVHCMMYEEHAYIEEKLQRHLRNHHRTMIIQKTMTKKMMYQSQRQPCRVAMLFILRNVPARMPPVSVKASF
jgi:hypothetical protein